MLTPHDHQDFTPIMRSQLLQTYLAKGFNQNERLQPVSPVYRFQDAVSDLRPMFAAQPCKRPYNMSKRKPRPKKVAFGKASESVVENINAFHNIVESACKCKKNCPSQFRPNSELEVKLFNGRNDYHSETNYADRRTILSKMITRGGRYCNLHLPAFRYNLYIVYVEVSKSRLLGIPVCIEFLKATLKISSDGLYGLVRRIDNGLTISGLLHAGTRVKFGNSHVICAWLLDLAALHDPQPDREFTILAHRRKHDVFREYCIAAVKRQVPVVSRSYFLSTWKHNVGSKVVVRKTMRFAMCNDCIK